MATAAPKLTLVQAKSGTRMVATSGEGSVFDFPEPPWSEDAKSSKCSSCGASFGLLVRKHHCRFCGKIFCGKCCGSEITSTRQGFVDPVRLCEQCTPCVKKDNDFMAKQLPLLVAGASFVVSGESDTPIVCRVEKAIHKHITYGEAGRAVALRSITKVVDITSGEGSTVNGLNITYTGAGDERTLSLLLDGVAERKKSMQWLGALKKALQALHGPTPHHPPKK